MSSCGSPPGAALPPRGHLAMSEVMVTTGEGVITVTQWVETRDVIIHPTVPKTASKGRTLVQHVSSAGVRRPDLGRECLFHLLYIMQANVLGGSSEEIFAFGIIVS